MPADGNVLYSGGFGRSRWLRGISLSPMSDRDTVIWVRDMFGDVFLAPTEATFFSPGPSAAQAWDGLRRDIQPCKGDTRSASMPRRSLVELAGLVAKIVPPLQGFCLWVHQNPGRCPGLKNAAPLGLKIIPAKLSRAPVISPLASTAAYVEARQGTQRPIPPNPQNFSPPPRRSQRP
jgi:hypothetical protein